MKTVQINVFEFDELIENSQLKAVEDHIQFWLDVDFDFYYENNENFKKAVDKCNSLQTPWFLVSYVYDYCKDDIINEIKLNEYLFYKDGELIERELYPVK